MFTENNSTLERGSLSRFVAPFFDFASGFPSLCSPCRGSVPVPEPWFGSVFVIRPTGLHRSQGVGSESLFQLPPAAPPLTSWSCLPRRITIPQPDGTLLIKRILPIWSNALARNLATSGIGFAILSWAHVEVRHKRQSMPSPLAQSCRRGASKVVSPPMSPKNSHGIERVGHHGRISQLGIVWSHQSL
jgi:hypothetical protein